MDCDLYDQHAMDALYGELGELTLADLRRHVDACQRCQASWNALRSMRDLAVLEPIAPPPELEAKILAAAFAAHRRVPLGRRVGRAISWAGGWAMRPQAAMAALLVLVVGSSLVLLRGRADRTSAASRVSVTEHGVPESREEIGVVLPRAGGLDGRFAQPAPAATKREDEPRRAAGDPKLAAAAAPDAEPAPPDERAPLDTAAPDEPADAARAPASNDDGYAAAMAVYRSGAWDEAARALDAVAARGGSNAQQAALFAARALEAGAGCAKATAAYEAIASRYAGSNVAGDALWAEARCLRASGATERARDLFAALRTVAGFRDRAEAELATLPSPAPTASTKPSAARPNSAPSPAR